MATDNDLRVLVVLEADTIVVTIPGTRYSVSYRKVRDMPWLVASDIRDDPDSRENSAGLCKAAVIREAPATGGVHRGFGFPFCGGKPVMGGPSL
jgi:hypothetical protein